MYTHIPIIYPFPSERHNDHRSRSQDHNQCIMEPVAESAHLAKCKKYEKMFVKESFELPHVRLTMMCGNTISHVGTEL